MDLSEQIGGFLKLTEGAVVEYKSARGGFPQSFWESMSAFANTDGGTIVLGVREKEGRFIPDGLNAEQIIDFKKHFWNNAHNKNCISTPLLVESDVEEFVSEGGARMLVFHIPRAPHYLRPIYLTQSPLGHTYKRRHEGDYTCSDDEVRQMFSDANNAQRSADSRILRRYTIEDIDLPTLQQYRRFYAQLHEGHPWNNDTDMQFLEHIGAYRKDRETSQAGFTVAGMLMFGKQQSITDQECCPYFFPDYREHFSANMHERWSNRVFPDGTWEANIFQFYSRVLPMLQQTLPVPFRLNDDYRRIDTTAAHTAVREALVNSLVHCAYTTMGNIVIDRYPNLLVLSNPGSLLVSIEEYRTGGYSVCRNPLLQKMFVFIGVGERAGSGAAVIRSGWQENGWEDVLPTIHETSNPDRVELRMPTPPPDLLVASEQPNHYAADTPKITHSQKPNANETKDRVYTFIASHPGCRTSEIAEHICLQTTRTKHFIYLLIDEGLVVANGANRNRTYSAAEK